MGCGGGKPRRKGRGRRKIDEWPSAGGVQQNREEDVINTRYKAKLCFLFFSFLLNLFFFFAFRFFQFGA